MEKSDLLHYKNLLLAKQQELSNGKRLGDSANGPQGDLVDMAASDTSMNIQLQLKQEDNKLLRAVEDALTRIRQDKFGTCEECEEPIGKARLEAVPWSRYCKSCKDRQDSRTQQVNPIY